jgi:hypothetical protein
MISPKGFGGAPVNRTRLFAGYRSKPPEGYDQTLTNGGAAPDYEGVLFADGSVVVRWLTQYRSTSVWNNWDDFMHVHGHPEYGTYISFQDGKDGPPDKLT